VQPSLSREAAIRQRIQDLVFLEDHFLHAFDQLRSFLMIRIRTGLDQRSELLSQVAVHIPHDIGRTADAVALQHRQDQLIFLVVVVFHRLEVRELRGNILEIAVLQLADDAVQPLHEFAVFQSQDIQRMAADGCAVGRQQLFIAQGFADRVFRVLQAFPLRSAVEQR